MSTTSWLLLAIAAHLALALAATIAVRRIDAYTRAQRLLQIGLALLIPALGVIVVLLMAKEALTEPPKPDNSRFDPDYLGRG